MMVKTKKKQSRISQVFHSVKEKVKEKIGFPYALLITIVVIIFALFILGIKIPFGDEGTSTIVENRVVRFLNLYYGILNITINNKTLDAGIWKINVNGYSSDGIVNLDVWMDANDFKVIKVSQNLVIPSEPTTIIKTGKEIGCSVGDKITVDVYIDPYDPWSIKYNNEIQNFINKFGENIRLNFRILSTYTYSYIINDANSPAYTALLYYECTKEKEYFSEFRKCVIGKYEKEKEFLSEDELLECAILSGEDKNYIKKCVESNYPREELRTDKTFAETFIGVQKTPIFVIDCRYIIYPAYIENSYCYLYPKTTKCKEE